jgi:enoyl-CoA hydratase/carnithine racemase
MKTEYETLSFEQFDKHICIVKMARPEVLNAMNTKMGLELRELWYGFYQQPEIARCIILTGEGTKGFCAGGDLKERNNMTDEAWRYQHAVYEQAVKAMMDCPIPIIAAVNGVAFGGGCELALNCDFIYAEEHARFALPEVKLGIMPGAGGTQNMPRAVGVRRAKEIVLKGAQFSSADAFSWGMVNKVCSAGSLMTEVLNAAKLISANAPMSVRQAKKSLTVATQVDLKTGYDFEIEAYKRLVSMDDRLEGINAFNEKRSPDFKGY